MTTSAFPLSPHSILVLDEDQRQDGVRPTDVTDDSHRGSCVGTIINFVVNLIMSERVLWATNYKIICGTISRTIPLS